MYIKLCEIDTSEIQLADYQPAVNRFLSCLWDEE